MIALVEAELDIVDCLMETVVSFAQLLTNVHRFSMIDYCLKPLSYCESKLKLPVFQNLNHLELGNFDYCDWNRVLMKLLNCAPFLETLVFLMGITSTDNPYDDYYVEVSDRECNAWSCTQTTPSCLANHLKRITIKDCLISDWELEMFKYFLKSSLVLEELDIIMGGGGGGGYFNSAARMLPKASNTCLVRISGVIRQHSEIINYVYTQ